MLTLEPTALTLPANLFHTCLSPTDSSTAVRFQTLLTESAGLLAIEAFDGLDVADYCVLGHATRELLLTPTPVAVSGWGGLDDDRIRTHYDQAFWRVDWRGTTLYILEAQWKDGYQTTARQWVIAPSRDVAMNFALDVNRVTNDPRESILVFHGSCWQRSKELYKVTQDSSFDDLILSQQLKDTIRGDFRRFIASQNAYEELGLAWRRGALFVGPPGNGKTHCLRALVKELGIPGLYVQSIKDRYQTDESNLKKVFERARQLRPCVLILEDIDALVTNENRSFFLNQLDGFEKNVGLIVLATTNHPDRLDPAILDRPSRFDRKYHFALPAVTERRSYLRLWSHKLGAKVGWSDPSLERIALATEGFSFAYLKELLIAALTRSLADAETFERALDYECTSLKTQQTTRKDGAATDAPSVSPSDVSDVDDD